jgi:hypothetical protein
MIKIKSVSSIVVILFIEMKVEKRLKVKMVHTMMTLFLILEHGKKISSLTMTQNQMDPQLWH